MLFKDCKFIDIESAKGLREFSEGAKLFYDQNASCWPRVKIKFSFDNVGSSNLVLMLGLHECLKTRRLEDCVAPSVCVL